MVTSHGNLLKNLKNLENLKKFAYIVLFGTEKKLQRRCPFVDTYTERRTTNEHHEGDLFEVEVEGGLKSRLGSTLSAGQNFFFSFCTSKFSFLEPGVSFYINYMAIATHNRRENNQQRQSSSSTISRRLART